MPGIHRDFTSLLEGWEASSFNVCFALPAIEGALGFMERGSTSKQVSWAWALAALLLWGTICPSVVFSLDNSLFLGFQSPWNQFFSGHFGISKSLNQFFLELILPKYQKCSLELVVGPVGRLGQPALRDPWRPRVPWRSHFGNREFVMWNPVVIDVNMPSYRCFCLFYSFYSNVCLILPLIS
jgi:hypothetical protein